MKCLDSKEIYFLATLQEDEALEQKANQHLPVCDNCFRRLMKAQQNFYHKSLPVNEDEKLSVDFNIFESEENLLYYNHNQNIRVEEKNLSFRDSSKEEEFSLHVKCFSMEFYIFMNNKEMYLLSLQFLNLLKVLVDNTIYYHAPCDKNAYISVKKGNNYILTSNNESNIVFNLCSLTS